jgi:hypothetical protein
MDNFAIAVLVGAAAVIVIFGLMMLLDKGKPATPPVSAAEKVGKR